MKQLVLLVLKKKTFSCVGTCAILRILRTRSHFSNSRWKVRSYRYRTWNSKTEFPNKQKITQTGFSHFSFRMFRYILYVYRMNFFMLLYCSVLLSIIKVSIEVLSKFKHYIYWCIWTDSSAFRVCEIWL